MESKEDEGGCATLTWEIQNFGLLDPSASREGCVEFWTPVWKTEHSGKSVWRKLGLYFMRTDICLQVHSVKDCLHLDSCQIVMISSSKEIELKLYHRDSEYRLYTVKRDDVFGEKSYSVLHNETMTLHCKIWEKTMITREFRISSVLHSFSYLWNIENFHPDFIYSKYIEEKKILFKACLESKSGKGICTHNVTFDNVSSIEHYVSCIDCKLTNEQSGVRDMNKFCDENNKIILALEICLNSPSLNLQLESVFAVHKIRQNPFILPSPPRYENVSEAFSGAPRDDLLLLYRDKLFSDATLNAEGKPFHVHRNILSARSPVFRAMFEKDEMNEGRSGVVDIDDVDSETVDRMLVYLYGDSLGSMQQWEEASALYYAADKYDIKLLKQKCASSLIEGLSVDKACEALVLADRHSDDQLKKCIVDFIRQNEEVISSEKWDSFQISNPLLVAKVLREMYLNIKKN